MDPILWILIVAAAVIALVGMFAVVRSRQRKGDVFATPASRSTGGSQ